MIKPVSQFIPFSIVADLVATSDYLPVENYEPQILMFSLTTMTGVKYTRIFGELEQGFAPAVLLPYFYDETPILINGCSTFGHLPGVSVDCYTGCRWSCYPL